MARLLPQRLAAGLIFASTAAVGACTGGAEVSQGPLNPSYLGIETVLLDGEMVKFRVAMTGARNEADVERYGRCAAAQYALIRGFGFARHVQTQVARTNETWRGDAVYLISAALPRGRHTIDAEVTVMDCGELGIPTV
ncbi:hypothetical protein Q9295_09790 [Xinfangfangia sp. CPCC 101601]|uniref:Lipoprotein n=1 Tax=Pseudogemmobacter lacusdianii TaxID=3069608 RepID=A0ABU0VY35_9RHOB|nr:hypothetical protein [Xinfangfangia sp. CPCC 101601]MDQ2066667.1 hypothetical protein [Xinfangfangia sp. CPCC 101601]